MPTPYHARLAISQYGDRFRAELFTEDLGDTDGELLPAAWRESFDRWMHYLQGGGALTSDAELTIGTELFDWLCGGGANRAKWTEVLGRLERDGRPLRLLIDSSTVAGPDRADADADKIHNLPYGLLFDTLRGRFLFDPAAHGPPIQYVRIVRRCTPRLLSLERDRWPLRLLLAAAEPVGLKVGAPEALRRLLGGLAALSEAFAVSVCAPGGALPLAEALPGPPGSWGEDGLRRLCRATRDQLCSALAGGPYDLVHLVAHGRNGGVLLCGPGDAADEVGPSALTGWFNPACSCAPRCAGPCRRGRRSQLAFLQVCRAAATRGLGSFGGLAQKLLHPGGGDLAAVVASPYALEVVHSTQAACAFYGRLAQGEPPDRAVGAVRAGLGTANSAWAFLELWARPSSLGDAGPRGAFQFVSPYRGLARFEERDADIFCGRDAEIKELLQILRDEPALAVVGDSGSGKSSLLQAGLIHRVRRDGLAGREWRIVSLCPGSQPARALLAALRNVEPEGVPEDPGSTTALLGPLREGARARSLLIVLDQFEEVFTLCRNETQRRALAGALGKAVRELGARVRIVLGMRSEYVGAAAALRGLSEVVRRPWVLRPPGPGNVRDIVAAPAQRCGYSFQGPLDDGDKRHRLGLLERVLADPLLPTAPAGSASPSPPVAAPLPLLELALERLWLKAVGRGSHELAHADLDDLGGLVGAVARHAEEVYQALPAACPDLGAGAQEAAERSFTGLVSARGTRRPRRREELQREAGLEGAAGRVIDHLVGERLLAVRSDPNNLAVAHVDLAHEVLLAHWARLKGWLSEGAGWRALKEDFERATEQWDRGIRGMPPRSWRGLPNPEVAAHFLGWIDARKPRLTPAQEAFAESLRALLGATLQSVLQKLGEAPPRRRSGRSFFEAIDAASTRPDAFDPVALRDREEVGQGDFVQAACWFGARLAAALGQARGQGMTHPDVRPDNIRVDRYGRPMLLGATGPAAARPSAPTPPERLGGPAAEAADRGDVLAVGAILFELLAGKRPDESELGADGGAAPSVRREAPDVPAVVDRAVLRCLGPAAGRYQAPAELGEALEGCRQFRRIEAALPPAGRLTRALLGGPWAPAFLLALLPHLIASVVNVSYNLLRLVPEDGRASFWLLVSAYNAVVYPLFLGLVWRAVAPVQRAARDLLRSRPIDDGRVTAARRAALGWPLWAVGLSCAGWLPGGVVFPLALCPGDTSAFWHFLGSFCLCGLIASTYTYFAAQYVVLRVLYPRLWAEAQGARPRMREELVGLRPRVRLFRFLAGLIPLAGAALLVGWGEERMTPAFRLLVIALIALGTAGFAVALRVAGLLGQTLTALTGGEHPPGD
jgi:hypothetical protein